MWTLSARLDAGATWTNIVHNMKTATVRDLRNNFSKLEAWLREGEEVRIDRRSGPVAWLYPARQQAERPVPMPDFAARLKALWGDRVFSEEEVAEMRAWELEGEQG